MLNLQAFQLLTDVRRMPMPMTRFFLRLFTMFDLTRWRALAVRDLAERFDMTEATIVFKLAFLLDRGLLEYGPPVRRTLSVLQHNRQTVVESTYRVTPRFLLHDDSLHEWLAQGRAEREREAIRPQMTKPKPIPKAPPPKPEDRRKGPRTKLEPYQRGWETRQARRRERWRHTTGSAKHDRRLLHRGIKPPVLPPAPNPRASRSRRRGGESA